MGGGVSILFALAFHNVPFHIFPTSKIKGNCSINLLEAQRRIMRVNSLSGFPMLKFDCELGQRYPAPGHVEASIPAFDEFLVQGDLTLNIYHSFVDLTPRSGFPRDKVERQRAF